MNKTTPILALDVSTLAQAKDLLAKYPQLDFVKVGMQLFYGEGFSLLEYLKEKNYRIFLDLKLHDIPNTVHQGLKSLMKYAPQIINIHLSGGLAMAQKAREAVGIETKLIGVTQLTSGPSQKEQMQTLLNTALEASLDGVVCSGNDSAWIKQDYQEKLITVVPGVRFAGGETHDQHNIITPSQARENGADYIVCGRMLSQAPDPELAYQKLSEELT